MSTEATTLVKRIARAVTRCEGIPASDKLKDAIKAILESPRPGDGAQSGEEPVSRLEGFCRRIVTVLERDEQQGYRSRTRTYVLDMLRAALAPPPASDGSQPEAGREDAPTFKVEWGGPPCPTCGFRKVIKERVPFRFEEDADAAGQCHDNVETMPEAPSPAPMAGGELAEAAADQYVRNITKAVDEAGRELTAKEVHDLRIRVLREIIDAALATALQRRDEAVKALTSAAQECVDAHGVLVSAQRTGGAFNRHMEEPLRALAKAIASLRSDMP